MATVLRRHGLCGYVLQLLKRYGDDVNVDLLVRWLSPAAAAVAAPRSLLQRTLSRHHFLACRSVCQLRLV